MVWLFFILVFIGNLTSLYLLPIIAGICGLGECVYFCYKRDICCPGETSGSFLLAIYSVAKFLQHFCS